MVNDCHLELRVVWQYEVVEMSRSSGYYLGRGGSLLALDLVRVIDEAYLKMPRYGSRDGVSSGPSRVRCWLDPAAAADAAYGTALGGAATAHVPAKPESCRWVPDRSVAVEPVNGFAQAAATNTHQESKYLIAKVRPCQKDPTQSVHY